MRLLLVNGNTTPAMTEAVAAVARGAAGPGTEIITVTASFGSAIISHRAEDAIAGHSLLAAAAERAHACDAVLNCVSSEIGLRGLRAALSVPVVGMTEAALLTACMLGGKFGLVGFSAANKAAYVEVVEGHGLIGRMAGYRVIDRPFAEVFADPAAVHGAIVEAVETLVREDGAETAILLGAATAGVPRLLQERLPVPFLDGIVCGVHLAEALVRLGAPKPTAGSYAKPRPNQYKGLSAPLVKMLGG